MKHLPVGHRISGLIVALCLGLALWPVSGVTGVAQTAQATGSQTGLPLPRFASVRNASTNVRVGPGTRYEIAWTFVRGGVPVEIVQEFDTWRKIRDVDGAEGWLHQSLVIGTRTALVTPWSRETPTALRTTRDAGAPVRAWLSPNFMVTVRRCDGERCEVRFTHQDANARSTNYQGFVDQSALWGVYGGEVFD